MKALKDANNKIIGRTVSASASGQPPISLTTTTQAALSALTAKGNTKRTITIDGTEYDVPDGYTLLDNSGSTATAFYCKRNSDSATGTINLTTGVFTASSFTAGNTLPTPDMSLGVIGVGDYVGGTQSYKIPIKRNNSIVGTIYASEPLHNLNTYTDVLKAIEGKVSRAIGKITLDGTEAISYNATTAGVGCLLHMSFAQGKSSTVCVHTHGTSHYPWTLRDDDKLLICMGTSSRLFLSIRYGYCGVTEDMTGAQKVAAFKAWLAAQYAAGTPVTVLYPLATATEETITALSVTLAEGTNYIDAGTDVTPTEMSASYQKTQLIMLNE